MVEDVTAALVRGEPSSVVAGLDSGTVRGFAAHHVWAEVPRVLEDRHGEGERFDLAAAQNLWWSTYVPLIRFVSTDFLPMTPEAKQLLRRDPSDVGTLQLLGVLAPAVVLASDKDLRRHDLENRHDDWGQIRAAIGKVGVVEDRVRSAAKGVVLSGRAVVATGSAVTRVIRANPQAAAIGVAAVGFWLYSRWRSVAPMGVKVRTFTRQAGEVLGSACVAANKKHEQGEAVWTMAERGALGRSLLHQVARILVCATSPMNRTEILGALDPVPGLRHRDAMQGLLRLLKKYPMFSEEQPGRWQIGRAGVDFGAGA